MSCVGYIWGNHPLFKTSSISKTDQIYPIFANKKKQQKDFKKGQVRRRVGTHLFFGDGGHRVHGLAHGHGVGLRGRHLRPLGVHLSRNDCAFGASSLQNALRGVNHNVPHRRR
ncbi:hypothetical protein JTE90_006114 [Oedothorax gibbosus]|uniref:Uncharacterized protein n=1 Tax=Oedothorax gibbosus TaxID=931172 RepID=A0AAV6V3U9_9ARAC|nr:hypothetical protein JTE90_006114 [Oedothorax gibbosus]